MTVNDFISSLDFNEYDYLYHITGNGKAENTLEEGLLVNGSNILDVDNILFTTATPLYPEDVVDEETFVNDLLNGELSDSKLRDTNEMVIIGCPIDMNSNIVDDYFDYIDGVFYEGFVDTSFIMGYFNKKHEFVPNEYYQYGTDSFYEEKNFKIKK